MYPIYLCTIAYKFGNGNGNVIAFLLVMVSIEVKKILGGFWVNSVCILPLQLSWLKIPTL